MRERQLGILTACVLVFSVMACIAGSASAEPIELGTATGGMAIYYNNIDVNGAGGTTDGVISGYDENPSNQAYIQFQFGYDNTNGMGFQFDDTDLGGFSWNDIFSGQSVGSSQFGLDILLPMDTFDPAGGVIMPDVGFYDNTDGTVDESVMFDTTEPAWAINDYKEPSGAESGDPINSLFRGNGIYLDSVVLTPSVALGSDGVNNRLMYQLDISGRLLTDGLFHWYNPDTAHSTLNSWGLQDTILFSGSLLYDTDYVRDTAGVYPDILTGLIYGSGLENGSDQLDFYGGTLTLSVVPVPLPATATLVGIGLIGTALSRIRKRRV